MTDNYIIEKFFSHPRNVEIEPYSEEDKETMLKAFDLTDDSTEEEKDEYGLNDVEEKISININNRKTKFSFRNYKDDVLSCNYNEKKVFFTKGGIITKYNNFLKLIQYNEELIHDILINILESGNFDFSPEFKFLPERNILKVFDILMKYTKLSKEFEEKLLDEVQQIIISNNIPQKNINFLMKAICRGKGNIQTFKYLLLNYYNPNNQKSGNSDIKISEIVEDVFSGGDSEKIRISEQYFSNLTEGKKKEFILKAFKGACRGGDIDIINYLFEGSKILTNYSDKNNFLKNENFIYEILKSACIGGHLEAFKILCDEYPEFFDLTNNENKILQLIKLNKSNPNINRVILIKVLEKFHNKNINEFSGEIYNLLYNIKDHNERIGLIKELLVKFPKININAKYYEKNIFYRAVENREYNMVEELRKIPKIDINDKNGRSAVTALDYAIINKDACMIQLLLMSNKIDVNIKNNPALGKKFYSFTNNKKLQNEMIYNFINNPNSRIKDNFNEDGTIKGESCPILKFEYLYITPLTLAIIEWDNIKSPGIICDLFNPFNEYRYYNNIDVNIKDEDIIIPPIFLTIMDNNDWCLDCLLDHENINVNLCIDFGNYKNVTPLHFAIMGDRINMFYELLQHKDINLNAEMELVSENKDYKNVTPLHFAIMENRTDIFYKLLQHKDINLNTEMELVNEKGKTEKKTPIKLAVELYKEGKIDDSIVIGLLKHLKAEELKKEKKLKKDIIKIANNTEKFKNFKKDLIRAYDGKNIENALHEIVTEISSNKKGCNIM